MVTRFLIGFIIYISLRHLPHHIRNALGIFHMPHSGREVGGEIHEGKSNKGDLWEN